jgi:hypothetical protein
MRSTVIVAVISALAACAGSVHAQAQFVWNDNRAAEPQRSVAFVRSYDNKISFEDHALAAMVSANVGQGKRWASVDVVMQQCFSGGFINDFAGINKPYSLTTAADWNQAAYTVQEAAGFTPAVENFTRAWVSSARALPNAGVRELAFRGRQGDWTGPISNDFNPTSRTNPQYGSADAAPGGANDTRTLSAGANERLFTGIGLFGANNQIAFRHFANALRVGDLMRSRSNDDRVVGLSSDGSSAAIGLTQAVRPDANALPNLRTPSSNTRASVQNLFTGGAFSDAAQAGDRLVFYATGHGGRASFSAQQPVILDSDADNIADRQTIRAEFDSPNPEQREAGGLPPESFNPNIFGDSDDLPGSAGIFDIELSLTQPLPMGAEVWINGVNLTNTLSLVPLLLARDLPDQSAGNFTPDAAAVYRVLADRSVVQNTQPFADVQFRNIPGLADNQNLVLGTSVRSGDVEVVHVNIPAPAAGALAGIAGVLAGRRRRKEAGVRA